MMMMMMDNDNDKEGQKTMIMKIDNEMTREQ